jgi:hypothetical protein
MFQGRNYYLEPLTVAGSADRHRLRCRRNCVQPSRIRTDMAERVYERWPTISHFPGKCSAVYHRVSKPVNLMLFLS